MTENSGTGGSSASFKPSSLGGKGKWIAIAVAVILVVAAVAVVYEVTSKTTTTPQTTVSGVSYSFSTNYGGALKSVSYSYGDGVLGTASSNGTNSNGVYVDLPGGNATFTHIYSNGGSYLFSTVGTFSNGSNSLDFVAPVQTISPTVNSTESAGFIFTNGSYTTAATQQNTSNIFENSGNIALELAYYTEPSNTSYQIYQQTVTLMHNGTSKVYTFNYVFNSTNVAYAQPSSMIMNFSASAFYGNTVAKIVTTTGVFNTSTGVITTGTSSNVTTYYDTVVSSAGGVSLISAYKNIASGTFTNAELETGGFRTLDPQLAYDTVSDEILANTYQQLTIYNGSSVTGYSPYLAKFLPTIGNGVNAHYHNYTATFNSTTAGYGSTFQYNITVAPGSNYTFTINPHATFQNGTPVTAYDVYYSLVRDLLFTGSPGTFNPGWILAQYILPGNYFGSASFYNITQNMTYSNVSNTITIHFQVPMAEDLVYQLFYTSGTYITSASWLIQHGAGITFSASGFAKYILEGSPTNWNKYVQLHVDANGPYYLYSVSQNSKVVMEANPSFVSPNKWVLAPSYKFVIIEYIAEPTTTYLLLKSGAAQVAGIPTSSWNEVQSLQANHQVNVAHTSTLSLFWYNYNANVNMSLASTSTPGINMPFDMFTSLHARKAFNFAYNHNQYLNYDIGNSLFTPAVNFASNYAGMMPVGMIGGVSFSTINSTSWGQQAGIGFNMNLAHQNWNAFVKNWNSNANIIADKMTLTNVSGAWQYNGSALNIPIYIFSADPVDLNGATAWAKNLAIITGDPAANFPVVPTAFPALIGNQVQGANPMPIYELGWAPDYPYPTDYLQPMANPLNGSTYPGPNDFTPWWFGYNTSNPYHNVTEANIMNQMLSAYTNGTQQVNTSKAMYWFHQENNMLINMSYYMYLDQANAFLVLSTSVNFTQAQEYQLGTVWVGAYFLYNDFAPA